MAWLADNWVWLIFGGGMVAMHMFGHGSHGSREKDGSQDKNSVGPQTSGSNVHTDPVCGKEVDPNQGYGLMHQSQLVRFCSRECLDRFEQRPTTFLDQQPES